MNSPISGIYFNKYKELKSGSLNTPGNYIVCLKEEAFSGVPTIFEKSSRKFQGLYVCYVGKATKSLKTRITTNHLKGNAGNSTLRLTIGILLRYKLEKLKNRDKWNFKNEKKVSDWMCNNLIFYYCANNKPVGIEKKLIETFQPPFNLNGTKGCMLHTDIRKKIRQYRKLSKQNSGNVHLNWFLKKTITKKTNNCSPLLVA